MGAQGCPSAGNAAGAMGETPGGGVLYSHSSTTAPESQAGVDQCLLPQHLAMLRDGSGISNEVILARGYRTITDHQELAALGFSAVQRRTPGLLLPLHGTDGQQPFAIYRPDNPRKVTTSTKKDLATGVYPVKLIKYESPEGYGTRVDCPPMCHRLLGDPSVPLWITEGQKKADALVSRRQCAIALLGVWNWKGKNDWGASTLLADFDLIGWTGRDVRICFDSDVMAKPDVRQALDRLTEHLQRRQAHVTAVYLPGGTNGHKTGVDDFLAGGHTMADLIALAESPRTTPQAAVPLLELLDAAPSILRKPLALIDGRAYAATWLPVRQTITESVTAKGEIVRHNPPLIKNDVRLFVVDGSGKVYGDGGTAALEDLGIEIHLPEVPPAEKTWSTAGVKAYRAGRRADPADVFGRMVEVISAFIDFDQSLADQRTMSEMMACYDLSTWFLDAFPVIGYLWPNGDRGSGKTQLLTVNAELSYLGEVILAGGSYPALRDLADYGASLAFDDCENLADKNKMDPDKRSLLLAGNRAGCTVTLKELAGDKKWVTRRVSTFCARSFSAIELPDSVLESRTIVVPLIRTTDRKKANADPAEYRLWPHDRRGLLDDLWALALAGLPELREHVTGVNDNSGLMGRTLEPWRPLLSVASWLESHGVEGVYSRMEALSNSYQQERPDLTRIDLSVLVIRGLLRCLVPLVTLVPLVPLSMGGTTEYIATARITDETVNAAKELEADVDTDRITSRRVGRVMLKMRMKKARQSGAGPRQWAVSRQEVERWAKRYGILTDEAPPNTNGTNGTNGPNGTAQAPDPWDLGAQ